MADTGANEPVLPPEPGGSTPRMAPITVAVLALGFTQIIAWGTTLYALGVLGLPIAQSTGWSQAIVFGGLTVGLLVSSVVSQRIGRLIDQRGARLVMSLGSSLAAAGLGCIAVASSPGAYLAAWALLGLAMRMTLYDAAFAALVQVTPTRGRQAISYLTLFGGLASTVFWPIGYGLEAAYGWRTTLGLFAALNLCVCLPLHWFGLATRDPEPVAATAPTASAPEQMAALEGAQKRHAMILFGCVMAASAFCYGALASHLVTVMTAVGLSAAAAVTLASVKGVAQTLARLGDLVFGKSLHPITLGRITLAFLPVSFAVLLWGGAHIETAFAFIILFGIANGLTTIVRGAVPLALFGTKGYGEILGILATPYLIMNAIAPMIFAIVAENFGGRVATVTLLAAGLIAWGGMEIMASWYKRQVGAKR
jgi:Major Facilitator Superfamily